VTHKGKISKLWKLKQRQQESIIESLKITLLTEQNMLNPPIMRPVLNAKVKAKTI
jgi:hypothetical protein